MNKLLWIVENILTGGVSGGVIGLLGSAFTTWVKGRVEKSLMPSKIELERIDAEKKKALAEIKGSVEEKKLFFENEKTKRDADTKNYLASVKESTLTYSNPSENDYLSQRALVIVDVVRGLTRPIITSILVIHMPTETIAFCGTMAVGWWFGDRSRHTSPNQKQS